MKKEFRFPVSKPSVTEKEIRYVEEAISGGWISSLGPCVEEFEENFARWNNKNYGVACSSGTAALTLALRSLGIGEGDEVIVPEFTMVASAWAVTYTGARPVFVDCKDDLNINQDLIERKISSRTKAIMPVHIYGRSCDLDEILNIAYEYNLRVIEDSAEAHGIKPRGDVACFSLYANKIISAGEGGICITDDRGLANQMKHLRSMAFSREHTFLHKKVGYNFRMTNLQAAVAKAQTERIDEILEKRAIIESNYDKLLGNIEGVTLMPKRNVLWMYDLLAEKREGLMKFLDEKGIETRTFFLPMSQQPMYYDECWKALNATKYSQRGMYLPTYTDLTLKDQECIAGRIKEFCKND